MLHCNQLPLFHLLTAHIQHPLAELASAGNSFSSNDLTRTADSDPFSGNATATAFLPPSVFQSITNRSAVGITFVVYDTGVLFPINNGPERNPSVTTVVGSPVLGILVGRGLTFSGLVDPVRIMLQVKQQEVGSNNVASFRGLLTPACRLRYTCHLQ